MRVGLVVVVCGLFGLAGCAGGVVGGMNEAGGSQAPGVAGARLTGAVHGGQNPVSGAHVYLFAAASGASGAGQAAYGGNGIAASASNASVSLLTKGSGQDGSGNYYVTTGGDGSFSVSGDYTCVLGQQVYLYSLGGDPGLGTGGNPAAGLMAVLGNCPGAGTFPSGMYVVVNEVSTVAAAYAMAGFATDATHVGSSGTALALTGIANAFANAANLETLGTGGALAVTPAGNGTVPQAEINTLANILASCVNSNGAGSACTTLFANAESGGTTGTVAADTATAAINIAHNPAVGVAALYGLASANPPFGGGLTSQPNYFSIGISFSGGGLNGPRSITIDGSGEAWIANYSGNSLSEFSNIGIALSPSTGYVGGGLDEPISIAIDGLGEAWIANYYNPSGVSKFSSSGVALSPSTGYTGGGLVKPSVIAIDGSGNTWLANSGNSVSKFSNSGVVLSPSTGYTGGGLLDPESIAIDGSGNAWIANLVSGVSRLSSAGAALSPSTGYTGGGLYGPFSVAIDSPGNVWIGNAGNVVPILSKFSNAGIALSPSIGYSGVGGFPIVIDGSGDVWAAGPQSVHEFSSAGIALSTPYGYGLGGGIDPVSIALDGSGDVWVANNPGNTVSELIGIATPVITPICAGLPATPTADGSSNLGTRP